MKKIKNPRLIKWAKYIGLNLDNLELWKLDYMFDIKRLAEEYLNEIGSKKIIEQSDFDKWLDENQYGTKGR